MSRDRQLLRRVANADVLADRRDERGDSSVSGFAEFAKSLAGFTPFGGKRGYAFLKAGVRCGKLFGRLIEAGAQLVEVALRIAPERFIFLAVFAPFFSDAGRYMFDSFEAFLGSHVFL